MMLRTDLKRDQTQRSRGTEAERGVPEMRRFLMFAIALCGVISSYCKAEQASAPGLVATYASGEQQIFSIVPTPNFALKEAESIHPQLSPAFGAQWDGLLKI